MAIVALLSGPAEPSLVPLAVAGAGLVERQLRQVRLAGAARVYVLGGRRHYGPGAVNLDTAAMLGPRLNDSDTVLVIAAGVIADNRIIEAVAAAATRLTVAAPVIATCQAAATTAVAQGVERIDALTFAAGVAAYPAALVRRIAAQLGDWDLSSTLLRAALCETACVRIDLASLVPAALTGEKRGPLIYALVTTNETASIATATVLAATAQPRDDALGRHVHPAIERTLLQWLAPTPVTPFAVAAVVNGIGVTAAVAFGFGWLRTGLVLALLFGLLLGIAERLAGGRVLPWPRQRWHTQAAVIGYSWWLALAVALTLMRGNGGPVAVAALILLAQLTAASEARALERLIGDEAEPANAIDRRIALLAANRDSLMLLLVPFAVADQWYAGFTALAVYAAASFAVTHARFLRQIKP